MNNGSCAFFHFWKSERSMEMPEYPRVLPAGDCSAVVEFGNTICEQTGGRIKSYMHILKQSAPEGVSEAVPTFRSVLVQYDPAKILYGELKRKLEALARNCGSEDETQGRVVRIPVCYGGAYGPNLTFVAQNAGLSEEEVIKRHAGREYLIYMLGFLPGFPYLGGLDEKLFTPRLETPRVRIPAGSVGIGGEQTGIYPLDSPGGWQLIGTTPVTVYDPGREQPIPYQAGDRIRFCPVTEKEFIRIKESGVWEF